MRQLEQFIGKTFEPFSYKVEESKVKELNLALQPLSIEADYSLTILPTFLTVIEFWGFPTTFTTLLNLDGGKVLHGEQSYEFFEELKIGDEVTVTTTIEDIYEKAKMVFIVIKRTFINQRQQQIAMGTSVIIERS